jgi:hypothetical protein
MRYTKSHSKTLFLFALLVAIALTACSGLGDDGGIGGGGGGGGGGGNGNATVGVTFQATPPAPPAGTNILSYSLTVGGVTLTPAVGTGNPINLAGGTFDLVRLQSDSVFLGTISAPAGTYTTLSVSFTSATVTYCSGVTGSPGCTATTVKQIVGGAALPVITLANGGLVLASNQETGISLDFDMGATLTIANQVITAVALVNANVNINTVTPITLGPTHPSSLTSTELDYLDDITGIVSVTGNAVTIKTANNGSLTATANSSTFYSPNCNLAGFGDGTSTINCVQDNQVASINAILNQDGTITLLSYDPLAPVSTTLNDWIEGTIVYNPTSQTQFTIVANDAVLTSSGTLLPSPFPIGTLYNVILNTNALFSVDTQGLNVPADASTFSGSSSTSVLLPGQTVLVHVKTYTPGISPVLTVINTDALILRFTRVAGTASQSGTTTGFTLSGTSLPVFFALTNPNQLVELTNGTPPATNSTYYDGITASTNITNGDTYSVRALYFGQNSAYPFVAAKVRQNPPPQ